MNEKEKGSGMPEWDDLQTIWQDSPAVDMTKMARSARFVWWRMRVNFAIEIIACLVGFGMCVSLLIDPASIAQTVFAMFCILFCGLGLYAAFRVRRGAWGDPNGDALSLVRLKISQAQSGVLYYKANVWLGVLALLMVPLAFWVLFDGTVEISEAKLQRVYLLIGLAVLTIVGIPLALLPYYRRQQREITELEAIERQLLEHDDD